MRYPVSPTNVNPKVTEPTASFNSEAVKVMGNMVLFILVYILLIVTAIVPAIVTATAAFITLWPN